MSPLAASLCVAIGGATGALGRFWANILITGFAGAALPYATFAVNVLGSFLIGVLATLLSGRMALTALVVTGALGGFTTFSTFSIETVRLIEDGRWVAGLGYALASLVACVVAAAAGIAAVRAAL
ncbi:fluoride efflux transporter CrcB [Acuticoccus sp. I52.16.1]|uniref:fluoride efflux transporter CrcB n=1 Tax=Acuticoccus sp. I52.16.1 TaxID=2928472 RepID=UPI001FD173BC|nr:fluoride efflux transporter CrcB [Acuticoccus sp. I52.16.1]UOM35425.1 fluoride efflux transporter CrcB [Acuticoccus sp. I52.16.1]